MKALSITLIAAGFMFGGCVGRRATDDKAAEARRASARAVTIAALASRHGADDQWEKPFRSTERFGVYTYELQRALIRPEGRAVIFVGSLDDVISLGIDGYEIRGHQSLEAGPVLYFSFKCKADQLNDILTRTPGLLDLLARWGIAATVTRLAKPMFKGSIEFTDDGERSVPELTVEAGDVVIATGACLEVVPLDDESMPPNKALEPTARH